MVVCPEMSSLPKPAATNINYRQASKKKCFFFFVRRKCLLFQALNVITQEIAFNSSSFLIVFCLTSRANLIFESKFKLKANSAKHCVSHDTCGFQCKPALCSRTTNRKLHIKVAANSFKLKL